ncbi:Lrp/AsnC ligand binding domain-containing protein [Candidatus Bathyarchaeota archaeon]|nr:Lrp/AsnC ligand binding domain-containing protein [Candidatus Bathyarchaeota archaeon]
MLNVCVLLKVVPTKQEAILEKIKRIKGVRKAFYAYGRWDIVAFLELQDYKSIRVISGEINSIDGVRSTETLPEA